MEEAEKGNAPSGRQSSSGRKTNARSSKAQAIKESQEEEEAFINKSVVDNDE